MATETLVKIYDTEGNFVEPTTREEAERKGLIMATIVVVLFTEEGSAWMSLRSHKKSTHRGKWDITVAGCVDADDETNLYTAKRELLEEAGLSVDLSSAGFLEFDMAENGGTVTRRPEVFAGVTSEIPVINEDEVDGFARFPLDALRTTFNEHTELFIPKALEEVELAAKHLGVE